MFKTKSSAHVFKVLTSDNMVLKFWTLRGEGESTKSNFAPRGIRKQNPGIRQHLILSPISDLISLKPVSGVFIGGTRN